MNGVSFKDRNYLFDNVRAFSIFLVVFGHMLETFSSSLQKPLYTLIYSFHIPLLVFMSGYFAKFNLKKIIFKILLPLLLFQGLYCLFDYLLYGRDMTPYLYTPYWLLWYLASLIFWRLIVFFLEKIKRVELRAAIVVILFVVGLLVGYLPFMTRVLSLSRSFVFLPFFVLGYYLKGTDFSLSEWSGKKKLLLKIVAAALSIGLAIAFFFIDLFPKELLYGANCYQNIAKTALPPILLRGILYAISCILIFSILLLFPKRKIGFLSVVSKYSIQNYLLHGFIVLAFKKTNMIPNGNLSILYTLLISIALVALITTIFYAIGLLRKKLQTKNSP